MSWACWAPASAIWTWAYGQPGLHGALGLQAAYFGELQRHPARCLLASPRAAWLQRHPSSMVGLGPGAMELAPGWRLGLQAKGLQRKLRRHSAQTPSPATWACRAPGPARLAFWRGHPECGPVPGHGPRAAAPAHAPAHPRAACPSPFSPPRWNVEADSAGPARTNSRPGCCSAREG